MQVLEHEQHRVRGALGRQPVLPGARIGSPISSALARAARSASRVPSSKGRPASSPRNSVTRRGSRGGEVPPDARAELLAPHLERLAVEDAGRARGSCAPASRTASPRPSGRRRRTAPRPARAGAATQSMNSWRRRDLPTPGRADHQHRAWRWTRPPPPRRGSSASRARARAPRTAWACRAAPLPPKPSRSPRRRRPCRRADVEARVEQPGGHVVEADGPRRRAPQQQRAAVDHLADRRPGRDAPCPVATTSGTSGRMPRMASAHRAARAA